MSAIDPREELTELYWFLQDHSIGKDAPIFEERAYLTVDKIYMQIEKMKRKKLPVPTNIQKDHLWGIYQAACRYLGRKWEPFNPDAMQKAWDDFERECRCVEE